MASTPLMSKAYRPRVRSTATTVSRAASAYCAIPETDSCRSGLSLVPASGPSSDDAFFFQNTVRPVAARYRAVSSHMIGGLKTPRQCALSGFWAQACRRSTERTPHCQPAAGSTGGAPRAECPLPSASTCYIVRQGVTVQSQSAGQYYARKVGETQREIQRFERERRRLARVEEHAFINLELSRGEAEAEEVARRAADIETAALPHHDEILRLSIEILKLQDRLQYYRQLEALHADGTIHGQN